MKTLSALLTAALLAFAAGCTLKTKETEIDIRRPHDAPYEDEEVQKPPPFPQDGI